MNAGDRAVVREVPVRVAVHLPGGEYHTGAASVILRQDARVRKLRRPPGSVLYEGTAKPGTYSLEVRAKGLVSPPRPLVVPKEGKTASTYLGEANWPSYRLGENVIPFEAHDDLVAIAFSTEPPKPADWDRLVRRLRDEAGIDPFTLDPKKPSSFMAANGAIWLCRLREPRLASSLKPSVEAIFGREARIGMAVNLTPGRVSVMDNRFVVRFRPEFTPQRIAELVEAADAAVLREFVQSENARLIEFRSGGYLDHLRVVERWLAAGHLIYGEPDLLSELTDHAFPATPPDDPKFKAQKNLKLQCVDGAWKFLHGVAPELMLGSPRVCVMTLDTGIEQTHDDVGGQLTDGTDQLAKCYDFSRMKPCGESGFEPNYHGMCVYGIIGARTNNGKCVSGIAPNTRQLAIKKPDMKSLDYADVLMWGAGFVTHHAKPWPDEPNPHPADVINCSHGSPWEPLSSLMDDTFRFLTDNGRNGLGTVLVYSAGNRPKLITDYLTWAAHPRTLAVANTNRPKAGRELINTKCAFGPEIDLCAQGEGGWSLTLKAELLIRKFGGTSAAAAMVSATAALMLSVNPSLRWSDVRDILRATAKKQADGIGHKKDWKGGFSKRYGFGRLDVEAAVRAAHALVPTS